MDNFEQMLKEEHEAHDISAKLGCIIDDKGWKGLVAEIDWYDNNGQIHYDDYMNDWGSKSSRVHELGSFLLDVSQEYVVDKYMDGGKKAFAHYPQGMIDIGDNKNTIIVKIPNAFDANKSNTLTLTKFRDTESFAAHLPCYFCAKEAQTEKGVLYYRTQLPSGKWGSVEICLPCLEHINKVKEGKWIKRTDPNNPQRFYYSKGDRLDYDAKTKKHGAYIRSGGGNWNEQQNAKGMGFDNELGKLVKIPNHLTKDFLSNSKTSRKRRKTSKRGMGFVLGGIVFALVAQRGVKK